MKLFKYILMLTFLPISFSAAYADTEIAVGTRLSPAEVSALGPNVNYTVGGKQITVITAANRGVNNNNADGGVVTTVVNANGVVGINRNEVLVAQLPTTTVQSQAASLLSAAKSVNYYEHMQITSLRYASFAQAVAGREKLQLALPKARVTLPIEYQQPKLN